MLPFILYVVTGVVTGLHVYTLMFAGFGMPFSPLELISLLGSLCLLLAAYLSLFRPDAAARLALVAALAMWCFYGPPLQIECGHTLVGRQLRRNIWSRCLAQRKEVCCLTIFDSDPNDPALSSDRASGSRYRLFLPGKLSTETRSGCAKLWLFPDRTARPVRITMSLATLALVIGLVAWFTVSSRNTSSRSLRFLIPEGYSGWVRVEFEVPGAPPLLSEAGQTMLKIPATGVLRTSSAEQYGWARDYYYFYSSTGSRPLPDSGAGRLIWGKINGEALGPSGKRQYEEFFVGTSQQYQDQSKSRE